LGYVLISLNVQVEGGALGAQKLNSADHELAKFKVSSNGSSSKRPRNDRQIKKGNSSNAARDPYEVGVGS
jgi:hypothetical protein